MEQKIYLAGGMKSDWQEKVKKVIDAEFYDPKPKEVGKNLTLEEFGTWDLHNIKKCDLVFAYMERTNPSGIGMSVEIGFAKALGKTIILCLEENNEKIKDRYLEFMKNVSDVVFNDFEDAINYLRLFH